MLDDGTSEHIAANAHKIRLPLLVSPSSRCQRRRREQQLSASQFISQRSWCPRATILGLVLGGANFVWPAHLAGVRSGSSATFTVCSERLQWARRRSVSDAEGRERVFAGTTFQSVQSLCTARLPVKSWRSVGEHAVALEGSVKDVRTEEPGAEEEEDEEEDYEDDDDDDAPFTGKHAPYVGRRLRAWFLDDEAGGNPDFEYGTIKSVLSGGSDNDAENAAVRVSIEWDGGEVEDDVDLHEMGNVEWLGEDVAVDLVANLKEHRQESLDGATETGARGVAMSVEQLRREIQALKWMREEVAARAEEAEALRSENAELRAQRDEFFRDRGLSPTGDEA